jgi:uncharacterized protein (TIGR02246 family)
MNERYVDWVRRYVAAWNSNDPQEIADLFTADAEYLTEPYAAPWSGRDEIVAKWLERKDEPGDTKFVYEVLVATPEVGIIKGVSDYLSARTRFFNLWEVCLEDDGCCSRFVEWWMEKPTT